MAITKGAKKAHRASLNKKVFNDRRVRTLRDEVKKISKLVKDKKIDEARGSLSKAYKAIDKAAKRGVIKPNTAARKKSRLTKLVNRG